MPRIYTKSGDNGESGLYDGSRVSKAEPIFDVLGTLDELSAHIGSLILVTPECGTLSIIDWRARLRNIQQTLLNVGSVIATPNPKEGLSLPNISDIDKHIEIEIDKMEKYLPELTYFLLVGGLNEMETRCHICRTVARRAEREFIKSGIDNDIIKRWLNRLSDYFFTLARINNETTRT